MPFSPETNIDEANIEVGIENDINNTAESTAVWYGGSPVSLPTYYDPAKVSGLNVPLNPAALLAANVDVSELVNFITLNAYESTKIRRAHAYLNGGTDHGISITALTDTFRTWYSKFSTLASDHNLENGDDITAANLKAAISAMAALLETHRTTATVVDIGICHSNCHSNCHGARGRR